MLLHQEILEGERNLTEISEIKLVISVIAQEMIETSVIRLHLGMTVDLVDLLTVRIEVNNSSKI